MPMLDFSKLNAPITQTEKPAESAPAQAAPAAAPSTGRSLTEFLRQQREGQASAPVAPLTPTVGEKATVVEAGAAQAKQPESTGAHAVTPAAPIQPSSGPEDFQLTLKQLDEIIGDRMEVSQLEIGTVRSFVVKIFQDLKTHPEYDGIVAAKDVHNLMVFVNSTVGQTENHFAVTKGKREKAETKKKGVNVTISSEAVNNMFAKLGSFAKTPEPTPSTTMVPAKAPPRMNLTTLMKANTDSVDPALVRNQKK